MTEILYRCAVGLIVFGVVAYLSARIPAAPPAARQGSTYILRHRLDIRIWLRFIPLGMALLGVYSLLKGEDPEWVGWALMSFYLFGLLCVPAAIRFDQNGIWQRSRLGILKYLSWKDISRVGEGRNFSILIYDGNGVVRIEHTSMHTGQDDLLRELERRDVPMWFRGDEL